MRGPIQKINFSGAKAMTATLNNAAVVTAVSGTDLLAVTIPATAHGFLAGNGLIIGSTNYSGLHRIISVDTNTFVIATPGVGYVAETLAGTETVKVGIKFPYPVDVVGWELHLSAAAATVEDITAYIDADAGSAYDTNVFTQPMSGIQDIEHNRMDDPILLMANDALIFAYANTDVRTWGMRIWVAPWA